VWTEKEKIEENERKEEIKRVVVETERSTRRQGIEQSREDLSEERNTGKTSKKQREGKAEKKKGQQRGMAK
jgi:hypothetical protein